MSASQATPITGLRAGDVAETVFLCGDPARVARLSAEWSEVREVCALREWRAVTGSWRGLQLSAASTGVGAPGTAILVEELAQVGARRLIRVGNSGGLAPGLEPGDLIVTTAAVRDDGTSRSYVTPEYPAAADWRIVAALAEAARAAGARWHAGITWSFDAFYVRNARMGGGAGDARSPDPATAPLVSASFGGYWTPGLEARIREMRAARVLNCEMEAGVLLTLAGLFGLQAGALCVVSDRTPWEPHAPFDLDRNMAVAIAVAHAAAERLAREER